MGRTWCHVHTGRPRLLCRRRRRHHQRSAGFDKRRRHTELVKCACPGDGRSSHTVFRDEVRLWGVWDYPVLVFQHGWSVAEGQYALCDGLSQPPRRSHAQLRLQQLDPGQRLRRGPQWAQQPRSERAGGNRGTRSARGDHLVEQRWRQLDVGPPGRSLLRLRDRRRGHAPASLRLAVLRDRQARVKPALHRLHDELHTVHPEQRRGAAAHHAHRGRRLCAGRQVGGSGDGSQHAHGSDGPHRLARRRHPKGFAQGARHSRGRRQLPDHSHRHGLQDGGRRLPSQHSRTGLRRLPIHHRRARRRSRPAICPAAPLLREHHNASAAASASG